MSMLPDRPIPVATTRRGGFSLVLSLTVMSMLLLLCIGAAALLAIELRVSRVSSAYARARLNAVAGARVALGEVQRLLGPDQRISATADILSTATDETVFDAGNGPASGVNFRPRIVGVWNSGYALNDDGETGHFLKRDAADGFITDRRFQNGRDWKADRYKSKRQLGWLVSGNEGLAPDNAAYIRPDTALTADDAILLGAGGLGKNFNGASASDGFGARGRWVTLPGDNSSVNRYAFWVEDEGVKARLNLDGRFAGKAPNAGSPNEGGYYNLMLPQRNNFDALASSRPKSLETATITDRAYSNADAERVRQVRSFLDLDNPDGVKLTNNAATLRAAFRHDIGFVSAGVLTDPVRGGFKRDLTGYLEVAANPDIATAQGLSGIRGAASMLADPFAGDPNFADATRATSDATRADLAPKWNLLRTWYGSPGSGVTPVSVSAAAIPVRAPNSYAPGGGDPATPYTIPDYKQYTKAPLAPILSHASTHLCFYFDKALHTQYRLGVLFMPKVVLWNPYSVPINVGGMRVRIIAHWDALIQIKVKDPADTTGNTFQTTAYQWTATTLAQAPTTSLPNFAQRCTFSLANETIPPGAAVVFTAPEGFKPLQPKGGKLGITENVLVKATGTGGAYTDVSFNRTGGSSGNPALPSTHPFFAALEKNYADPTTEVRVQVSTRSSGNPLAQSAREGNAHTIILLQDSAGNGVQQIDMDHYMTNPHGYGISTWGASAITPMMMSPAKGLKDTPQAAFNSQDHVNFLYRLNFIGESAGSGALVRTNQDINGFVQYNVRATRHTRFPGDLGEMGKMQRLKNEYVNGLYTTELDGSLFQDSKYINVGGFTSPIFDASKGSFTSPRFALFDHPFSETGVSGVGALQSAPLTQLALAPALAVGNGFLHPGIKTDSTGWTRADENTQWDNATPAWKGTALPAIVKQREGAPGLATGAGVTENSAFSIDWAYELNEALWDSWFSSGIPAANPGWTSNAWNARADAAPAQAFRNARLTPATPTIAAQSELYRAAQSLLLDGAFNVNSTSVAAWTAMLSATRGLAVPTQLQGTDSATGVAFLRSLRPPLKSTTTPGTYSAETWGGFRRLSDADVRTLAEKIVAEVRTRGPFLGLADFVNRRLKPGNNGTAPTDDSVYDYLGTLQAAIERAKLNAPFDGDQLNRTAAANPAANNGIPAHRVAHKAAGAPGYLLQSDMLQHLGPVLTARSDTFTIRSRGECNGATAIIEYVVQRTPAPVTAPSDRPFSPKTPTSPAPGYREAQLFGRRFQVIATRWLSPDEI